MSDVSLRMSLFQRYTQLQLWVLSRLVWYAILTYLVTLVLFALLRLFTGISVKRIGYFCLRHIVVNPKQGVEIRIGRLGLIPHRPTVARPGFFTFIVSNLEVIIDPEQISEHELQEAAMAAAATNDGELNEEEQEESLPFVDCDGLDPAFGVPLLTNKETKAFKITQWVIKHLRVFNFELQSTSIVTKDINYTIFTAITLRLDLRKTLNSQMANFVGTLDSYKLDGNELPVTMKLNLSDVYGASSLDDESPWQVFEDLWFDVTGVLHVEDLRIKQVGVQIHAGRFNLDVNHVLEMMDKIHKAQNKGSDQFKATPAYAAAEKGTLKPSSTGESAEETLSATMEETIKETSEQNAKIADHTQAESKKSANGNTSGYANGISNTKLNFKQEDGEDLFSDAWEFPRRRSSVSPEEMKKKKDRFLRAASIMLHLVMRVQFTNGITEIFGIPVSRHQIESDASYLAMSMKDLNLDFSRMNSKNSGFRLSYDEDDFAHQAICTVASFYAGIDNRKTQEEILYIPLVTSLTRTNLFSQTLKYIQNEYSENKSKVKTRAVMHSPHLSVEEHQFPDLVRAALRMISSAKQKQSNQEKAAQNDPSNSESGPSNEETDPTTQEADPSLKPSEGESPKLRFVSSLPLLDIDLVVNDPAARFVCEHSQNCNDAIFVASSSRLHMDIVSKHDKGINSYGVVSQFEATNNNLTFHSRSVERLLISTSKTTNVVVTAKADPTLQILIEGTQHEFHISVLNHEIFYSIAQLHSALRKARLNWFKKHPYFRKELQELQSKQQNKKSVQKSGHLRRIPAWLTMFSFEALQSSFAIASNQFRGQTNEILGVMLASDSLRVHYISNGGDSCNIESPADGRKFSISGSDINLYKADRGFLEYDQTDKDMMTAHTVAQLPKLGLSVHTCASNMSNVEFHVEPRIRIQLNINLILAFSVLREIIDLVLLRHVHSTKTKVSKNMKDEHGNAKPEEVEEEVHVDVEEGVDKHHEDNPNSNNVSNNGKTTMEVDNEHLTHKPDIHHSTERYNILLTLPRALIKVDMPSDDQIMLELVSARVHVNYGENPELTAQALRMYSEHPFQRGAWCILMSYIDLNAEFNKYDTDDPDKIKLDLKSMRINVPYNFKLYRIIDNGITLAKAMRTVMKQTSTHDIMLTLDPKRIEGVPNVPRIHLNTNQLCVSLEDDYFESDLTLVLLTQMEVSTVRCRKMYELDRRIKNMLRIGVERLEQLESERHAAAKPVHRSTTFSLHSPFHSHPHQRPQTEFNSLSNEMQDLQDVIVGAERGAESLHQSQHYDYVQRRSHTPRGSSRDQSTSPPPGQWDNHIFGFEKKQPRRGRQNSFARERPSLPEEGSEKQQSGNRQSQTHTSKSQGYIDACAHALMYVTPFKIQALLHSGMELGVPADDGDEFVITHHPWLAFWSDSDFDNFRRLLIPLEDGKLGKLSVGDTRLAMLEDFSRSWIDKIRADRMTQQLGVAEKRNEVAMDELDPGTCAEERIVDYSQKPLTMLIDFRKLDMVVEKTTYGTPDKLAEFIYSIGKKQPKATEYSILIPLYIDLRAHGGLKVELKDFPLPVTHFPGLSRQQDPKKNMALQIKGNLIITEALVHSERCIRKLFVPLRPLPRSLREKRGSDVLEVHRTLTPIKTFTDLKFICESTLPTRVCWCMAYKPGFHSVGEAFHGFSKPPIDPSPALGFWDKIRLVFHARLKFELPDSALALLMKAGKSPYALLNDNSGFMFIWKDNVNVEINQIDNPKELFKFDSELFELVVPNFMVWESEFLHASPAERVYPRTPNFEKMTHPEKVVFSLNQHTTWKLGMSFEKSALSEHNSKLLLRDQNFRPHYDIQLSMPEFIKDVESYDAYTGFRSDYINMAISVVSRPLVTAEEGVERVAEQIAGDRQIKDKANACAIHLTHKVMHHFKVWKDQFSSKHWPPIRTGSLFPDPIRVRPSNKTFGTALSTAVYQVALSPLDLSFFHQMRRSSVADSHDRSTGLKAKIDDIVFDWHTRREPPELKDDDGNDIIELHGHRRWRMRSYLGQVSLQAVQVRVVDAKLSTESTTAALKALHAEDDDSEGDEDIDSMSTSDAASSSFAGSPHSRTTSGRVGMHSYGPQYFLNDVWIDLDDFTDIGVHCMLRHKTPHVKVLPLMFLPQFLYMRRMDFSGKTCYVDTKSGKIFPKFFEMGIHDCLMLTEQPSTVQNELLEARQQHLQEEMKTLKASLESLVNGGCNTVPIRKKMEEIRNLLDAGAINAQVLADEMKVFHKLEQREEKEAQKYCKAMRNDLNEMLGKDAPKKGSAVYKNQEHDWLLGFNDTSSDYHGDLAMFRNLYIVHSMHVKWNNSVRNLLYRLHSTLSEDKELNYVCYRRAVQYLEELVAKADKAKDGGESVFAESTARARQTNSAAEANEHSHYHFATDAVTHSKDAVEHIKDTAQHPAMHLHRHASQMGNASSMNSTSKSNFDKAHNCSPPPEGQKCRGRLKSLFQDLKTINPRAETVQKSHAVVALSPRIQMIAEENPNECLQLVAQSIELQVVDIYSRFMASDSDSAKIERRYATSMTQAGFFVLAEEDTKEAAVSDFCLERYSGDEDGSSQLWPPWISIEMCYNKQPLKQFLVIDDVSFGVRFDQPNQLHVSSKKENETRSYFAESTTGTSAGANGTAAKQQQEEVKEKGGVAKAQAKAQTKVNSNDTDENVEICGISGDAASTLRHHGRTENDQLLSNLVIDFPQLKMNVDSKQFATLYSIGADLLTYRDPLIQKREKAIERVFLSNDFKDDYHTTLKDIILLQKDIRTLQMLRDQLQIATNCQTTETSSHSPVVITPQGASSLHSFGSNHAKIDLIKVQRMVFRRQTQLLVHMRAFKASLRKHLNTGVKQLTKWSLLADSIVLRILRDDGNPFLAIHLRRVHYSRLLNEGTGSMNRVTLQGVYAKNLLDNSTYSQILANYEDPKYPTPNRDALKLKWTKLERVGGIPVLDNVELSMKPMHIQLEYGVYKHMLDFAFPISHHKDSDSNKDTKHAGGDEDSTDIFAFDDEDSDEDLTLTTITTTSSVSQQREDSPSHKGPKFLRKMFGRKKSKRHQRSNSDDVEEMMNRASNYWSIRMLRIEPTQITASYKGKSRHALLSLQNLEIPLPLFEVENRTWTKLGLLMRLKKMVIRTLLHQTGSILGNKFTMHKDHTAQDDRDLGLDYLGLNSDGTPELDWSGEIPGDAGDSDGKGSRFDAGKRHIEIPDRLVVRPVHRIKTLEKEAEEKAAISGGRLSADMPRRSESQKSESDSTRAPKVVRSSSVSSKFTPQSTRSTSVQSSSMQSSTPSQAERPKASHPNRLSLHYLRSSKHSTPQPDFPSKPTSQRSFSQPVQGSPQQLRKPSSSKHKSTFLEKLKKHL